jgi:hypothetical protein
VNKWIMMGVLALAAGWVGAAPIIDVGTHEVIAAPSRAIPIRVTGGQPVQGLELMVQIEDRSFGPLLETADILTGTIFAGNNTGIDGGSYVDNRWLYVGTTTRPDTTVTADGLLATIYVDTTGLSGSYRLRLINEQENEATNFAGVEAEITDGWIVIVPEPTSLAVMAAAGVAGAVCRRRRSRTHRG